jgi:sulfite dehydrogenase (quinone) subunit SoeC
MRPAYSVILFTTLSGAGYGLMTALGLMLLVGATPAAPLSALAVGILLATVGLLASTFHLGRRGRAWRAFSQWRTSWLSREAVAALATYAAATALAWLIATGSTAGLTVRLAAAVTVAISVLTVLCTAMIYASLRPVRQWRHWTVPMAYLLFAIASGSLVLTAIERAAGNLATQLGWAALASLALAWTVRELNWRTVHGTPDTLTPADATGLGRFGRARLLDAPNTEANYLLREFGFRVARRHASRLRHLARLLGLAIPTAMTLLAISLAASHLVTPLLSSAAALSALAGILIERWLFFAEAKHTVTLYYGAVSV